MNDMAQETAAQQDAQPGTRIDVVPVGARIDVVSDVICPWCYIGKRQLERALVMLEQDGLHFSVHWNPFQLNPDMPAEGRDRAAYRTWKFGSLEKSNELDKRTSDAAAAVGLQFRTDLMARTPNTMAAHRLVWFADRAGKQPEMMERLFQAYFTQGKEVGDLTVLADCAEEIGLDRQEVTEFLAGDLADHALRQADQAARESGVSGVPSFFLDGYGLFSGAMPAETIAQALRRGREILVKQAAEG
jgi:predicted DsbA family dithiol-disulfide isomerase